MCIIHITLYLHTWAERWRHQNKAMHMYEFKVQIIFIAKTEIKNNLSSQSVAAHTKYTYPIPIARSICI